MTYYHNRTGTKKRQSKQVSGKTTLKYGGGKAAKFFGKIVPARIKGMFRKGNYKLDQLLQQVEAAPDRYPNKTPSPIPSQESNKPTDMIHIAPPKSGENDENPYEEVEDLSAEKPKSGENDKNPYEEVEDLSTKKPKSMKKDKQSIIKEEQPIGEQKKDPNEVRMIEIDWKNRQKLTPVLVSAPNSGEYVGAEVFKKRKAKQKETEDVLKNFKFPSPPKSPPTLPIRTYTQPTSSPKEPLERLPMRNSSPKKPSPKKQSSNEPLERLPTRRQSVKKTNAGARWVAAMAAQKPPSPKTRKSQAKTPRGNVAAIVANWGKK